MIKLFKFKIKKLINTLTQKAGKNNSGKITIKNRGGGSFVFYRLIDHKRFLRFPAIVLKQLNLKHYSTTVALILYKNGCLSYILSANNLINGCLINIKDKTNFKYLASNILIKNANAGSILYNLEINLGYGAQFCRAAGNFFQILNLFQYKKLSLVLIRLKSKKRYLVNSNCSATIGVASNLFYNFYYPYYKAGQNRNKGRRPHVRGVAMNPVDHPHGGNTSGGRPSVSKSGVLSKGYKTKKKKTIYDFYVNKK